MSRNSVIARQKIIDYGVIMYVYTPATWAASLLLHFIVLGPTTAVRMNYASSRPLQYNII